MRRFLAEAGVSPKKRKMNYKGYEAIVEFDEDARILSGEVINTRDVITFQADSADEVEKAFHDSVDDYIEFCKERGEDPEKPFSGIFSVRMTPEQHRQVTLEARRRGLSLNAYVVDRLTKPQIMEAG
ncbi:MAG TPA: type II toxin-antitoxin system HicB family antitoxin [Bryobacteraceae bacterium]|jgi:predicted HicB family RNase H-like nuclease